MSKRQNHTPGRRLSLVVMLFFALAFLLLGARKNDSMGYTLALAVPAMIFVGTWVLPHLFPTDRLLMSLTNFLCALGVLLLYDTNPAYALQQVISYGVGLFAMILCIYFVRAMHTGRRIIWLIFVGSLALLSLPLLLGREINGAKNWITIGSFSLQPSELVKLSLVLSLAFFLSQRRMLPWVVFSVACLGLLLLQKDLGAVLLYYGTTLLLFWAATGNLPFSLLGVAGGVGAAWYGYQSFAHVRLRVSIWLDPWADYENAGYQLVQGLNAIASGGLWGVGLGLGSPTSIPVYESDFIFAVLCEQFGLVFAACVLLIYVALIWRGATIAMSARRRFHGLLAMGATLLLGLQAFVILGGVLKLIPLTGVTLPFISYGGSSLVSSLCLVGFIQGVESLNESDLEEDTRLAMLERGNPA
ncbi:MAG: FtsW/RodA/SpoVE family cell cycle protein [Clostridia bacterium]|nr:FtsW/RodA/SpoVE family cell cycle protein [Clostridia bacterium]